MTRIIKRKLDDEDVEIAREIGEQVATDLESVKDGIKKARDFFGAIFTEFPDEEEDDNADR